MMGGTCLQAEALAWNTEQTIKRRAPFNTEKGRMQVHSRHQAIVMVVDMEDHLRLKRSGKEMRAAPLACLSTRKPPQQEWP